ncbi:MAG: hypothetical protein R3C71_09060 [Candidatus Krumholzibacteriia bacterium]|nr:hypothetical protein [bacterium]MCB9512720.1 hypothetical protein [Candidatus Latescibacterota bacterium]MCB9516804.1 hypothetical protein [Candidatus Latescibacterota bacterium]
MKRTTSRRWIFLGLAVSAGLMAGCGTAPPCNVEPAQVEQARAEYQSAEATAQQMAEQKQDLQTQITSLKQQVVTESEYQALEQRLETLKQGSGR